MKDSDVIVVGRFGRTHGVKGYVKVISFTEPTENILSYRPWYVQIKQSWQTLNLEDTQVKGAFILAKVVGYEEKESASFLTNLTIAVERNQLKSLEHDEFYWHQLVGLQVETIQGQPLGKVVELMATGPYDLLVIKGERRHTIPFILDKFIVSVNISEGKIIADWGVDY